LKGLKVQAEVLTETVEDLRKRCGSIAIITSFKHGNSTLRPLRASVDFFFAKKGPPWVVGFSPKFWRTPQSNSLGIFLQGSFIS
jgi:hypothetical protein